MALDRSAIFPWKPTCGTNLRAQRLHVDEEHANSWHYSDRLLGVSIRERRRALGMSQEHLAEKAGLHRTYCVRRLAIAADDRPLLSLEGELEQASSRNATVSAPETRRR